MVFPADRVKELIYQLVIDGEDGILAKAKKLRSETIPSYLAAKSNSPAAGHAKPILATMLPFETLLGSSIERSLSTSMGWRLDTIFTEIAKCNYSHAYGGKGEYVEMSGLLTDPVENAINEIMSGLKSKTNREKPSQTRELRILQAAVKKPKPAGSTDNPESVRFDVFFLDDDDEVEWSLESKTIKPNKNQLEATKRDALVAQALKLSGAATYRNSAGEVINQNSVLKPILGTYYEAWGPLVDGNFPTINTFFERGEQFRSGKETWSLVGKDDSTYDMFMELLWDVHCERSDELTAAFSGDVSPVRPAKLDPKVTGLVLRASDTKEVLAAGPLKPQDVYDPYGPAVILHADTAVWKGISNTDNLRSAIQSELITIGGFYPLLFTHQSRIVTRTIELIRDHHSHS